MKWCEDFLFDVIQDLRAAERIQDHLCFRDPNMVDIKRFARKVNDASIRLNEIATWLNKYYLNEQA